MSLKIQYASDLHLEFPENKEFIMENRIQPVGDILVLAGDILKFKWFNNHHDFWDYISDNFKMTFWLPGNHEYYQYDISKKSSPINEVIKPNVHLVNNTSVIYDNVLLIFSTLWSHINPENEKIIRKSLSDFQIIKNENKLLSVDYYNQLHHESLDFIKNELNNSKDKKTVVFTHHCPTLINYPEEYIDSPINNAFATELKDLILESNISYWVYGHHHKNIPEFNLGQTKLLTNQLGYLSMDEHLDFRTDKYFEI